MDGVLQFEVFKYNTIQMKYTYVKESMKNPSIKSSDTVDGVSSLY